MAYCGTADVVVLVMFGPVAVSGPSLLPVVQWMKSVGLDLARPVGGCVVGHQQPSGPRGRCHGWERRSRFAVAPHLCWQWRVMLLARRP